MTNICHKCTEIDALCTKCAAAAECLECQTGHYVNFAKNKCVDSCKDDDTGNKIHTD